MIGFIICGSNKAIKFDLMNSQYDGLWDLSASPLSGSLTILSAPELSLKR